MDDYERASTRRELLRLGVAAGVAAVWAPRGVLWGWSQAPLAPTTPTTPGPFYPIIRPMDRDSDLTRLKGHTKRAQGQVIDLVGRVLNARGEPVVGARIELWQANALGRYDHPSDPNPAPLDPDFQGYADQLTTRRGGSDSLRSSRGRIPRREAPECERRTSISISPDTSIGGSRSSFSGAKPSTIRTGSSSRSHAIVRA